MDSISQFNIEEALEANQGRKDYIPIFSFERQDNFMFGSANPVLCRRLQDQQNVLGEKGEQILSLINGFLKELVDDGFNLSRYIWKKKGVVVHV